MLSHVQPPQDVTKKLRPLLQKRVRILREKLEVLDAEVQYTLSVLCQDCKTRFKVPVIPDSCFSYQRRDKGNLRESYIVVALENCFHSCRHPTKWDRGVVYHSYATLQPLKYTWFLSNGDDLAGEDACHFDLEEFLSQARKGSNVPIRFPLHSKYPKGYIVSTSSISIRDFEEHRRAKGTQDDLTTRPRTSRSSIF